ncbi:hypothetical protein PV10_03934 [Exophiala mesophila]|uniref:Uncharacterized protein n=1 Tax=Exophiala mesophila TaxID=212818 RepID=A0A0D1XWR2_EXOME|nr:uncharacterized protein PV10_03934 [Exophiala mesophila]KIV92661.1 hypothetical protein PV10_03934 [Exophiala mesophila]
MKHLLIFDPGRQASVKNQQPISHWRETMFSFFGRPGKGVYGEEVIRRELIIDGIVYDMRTGKCLGPDRGRTLRRSPSPEARIEDNQDQHRHQKSASRHQRTEENNGNSARKHSQRHHSHQFGDDTDEVVFTRESKHQGRIKLGKTNCLIEYSSIRERRRTRYSRKEHGEGLSRGPEGSRHQDAEASETPSASERRASPIPVIPADTGTASAGQMIAGEWDMSFPPGITGPDEDRAPAKENPGTPEQVPKGENPGSSEQVPEGENSGSSEQVPEGEDTIGSNDDKENKA